MARLVAAPDKLRGTATAAQAAAAVCEGARRTGSSCREAPMSDGGEGFLDAIGGEVRSTRVRGPLGEPVDAAWSMLEDGTAIIESARAVGRSLIAAPRGDDAVAASTYGVGELLAAAVAAGAREIVVGLGGSSTTDGGLGALAALDELGCELRVPLVAACDVRIAFLEAATMFGPQKGATAKQVTALDSRLRAAAATYLERFDVDVAALPGTGAAGGLAGGLAALGAALVSGAGYVCDRVGIDGLLDGADLVVTGEGTFDAQTLEGKAVAVVLARRPSLPALVVAGRVERASVAALRQSRPGPVEVLELDAARQRSLGTPGAIAEAVASYLSG